MSRKFGPKTAGGVNTGKPCPACDVPFKEGDFTALVSLGPGDDLEEQEKARAGRAYTAVAAEVHWACAGGSDD